MPKLSGINHLQAVRTFEKYGFEVIRQSKHIIMTNGKLTITIPRNNPIKGFTMAGIIKEAGLTIEEFKEKL